MNDPFPSRTPLRILPIIVISQFAGTSLWFASNALLRDLQQTWGLSLAAVGHMTSAVQLGFIFGTLLFAVLVVSDRFSPRIVFFVCSLLGALFNGCAAYLSTDFTDLLIYRTLTGFCLAGIYPVGMKIAAGWYNKGLGNAIGWLVGALVLGTALPHLIKNLGHDYSWQLLMLAISGLAAVGGLLMFVLVPDGPYLSKGSKFDSHALVVIFKSRLFRASAFGYFGHMWELYALWVFVPVALQAYVSMGTNVELDISFWSFFIIGAGSLGCIVGGLLSRKYGSGQIAFIQLFASGLCCLLSPLIFLTSPFIFLLFWIFWGIVVVGDSPQFSTLNAQNAPKHLIGSALTIANCIGFSITIISIQLLNYLVDFISIQFLLLVLAMGPVIGLISMKPMFRKTNV
ncbi:MFS transporter [Pseudomonadota bacterium]